ncbi:MAG: nitroreductase [Salaquimonas sp.]
MKVSQAIETRRSTRAFTDKAVDSELIIELLIKASQAPSGGNVQPWKIVLLNGEKTAEFKELMRKRLSGDPHPDGEKPEYDVYPDKLIEPYRTARFEVGEGMYRLLDIPRENKTERLKWFAHNYQFFGAPAGIFCFIDRIMGPPQWSDVGMYLQSFMLLLEEVGLQSCAQECWYTYPKTVSKFCKMPETDMLFCGMAIGHGDDDHPVNQLKTNRLKPDEWLKIL